MSSSRVQPPTVNLKDRIAALQQRNVTPSQRSLSPSPVSSTAPNPSSEALKAKIAKFEKKGGVPVPRGRFGLGAPPPQENGQQRRQGELYGNRIPMPVRMVSGGASPISRSGSPIDRAADKKRSFSFSSSTDYDYGSESSPLTSPYLPSTPDSFLSGQDSPPLLVPHSTGGKFPRGTAFATALEIARKAELDKLSEHSHEHFYEDKPSTPILSSALPVEEPSFDDPPAIIVSFDDSLLAAQPQPLDSPNSDSSHGDTMESDVPSFIEQNLSTNDLEEESTTIVEEENTQSSDKSDSQSLLVDMPLEHSVESDTTVAEISIENEQLEVDDMLDGDMEYDPVKTTSTEDLQYLDHQSAEALSAEDVPVIEQVHITPSQEPTQIVDTPTVQITDCSSIQSYDMEGYVEQSELKESVGIPLDEEPIPEPQPVATIVAQKPSDSDISATDVFGNDEQVVTDPECRKEGSALPTMRMLPSTPESPIAKLTYDSTEEQDLSIPQYLLSPLSSSQSSSPVTDTYSPLAPSFTSSRRTSTIELSPSRVTHAHRITPATSRGIPYFIPPSEQIKQLDNSNLPSTSNEERTEFGSVTLHKASHSYSVPRTYISHYAEPELVKSDSNARQFSAVVHAKVREAPGARSMPRQPETPYMRRVKQSALPEPPPSPGQGELSALLKEAVLLEDTLLQGRLPTEAPPVPIEPETLKPKIEPKEIKQDEFQVVITNTEAQREGIMGNLRNTFLLPLSKSKSLHRKQTSDHRSHNDAIRPKSSFVDHSRAAPVRDFDIEPLPVSSHRPKTPETNDKLPPLPQKSPNSRFANIRRHISRSATVAPGGHVRNSISTSSEFSSEDSAPALTPPDQSIEFGITASVGEFGQAGGNGHGVAWPSVSPKKSVTSLGRAASFAEKMWSRARTKSGASTLSSLEISGKAFVDLSKRNPDKGISSNFEERMMAESIAESMPIGPPPSAPLPRLPPILGLSDERPMAIQSAKYPSSGYKQPPSPLLENPLTNPYSAPLSSSDSPHPRFTQQFQLQPDGLSPSLLDSRPSSWVSVSSTTSTLPSPMFSRELVDAFPSVPGGAPQFPGLTIAAPDFARDSSAVSSLTPSFDTAFLSSAIHLTSAHKASPISSPYTSTPFSPKPPERKAKMPSLRSSIETQRL